MANQDMKKHDYHLVNPSIWPAMGSVAVLVFALGAILAMKIGSFWLIGIGTLLILYTMLGWWREVIQEGNDGDHTPVVELHLRYGMILFILSEVMFFVAWFWAYFNASLYPGDAAVLVERMAVTGGVWPPENIIGFDPWHLPFINTLILLTSGTSVTWAHHALLNNDREGLKNGLLLTIVLGVSFTCLQAYEYMHAGFPFSQNLYGAVFFMATGFHGFHVIIGTIFLSVCYFRARKGAFSPERHFGFEAAAWYWHFVDVVWLFLFVIIYVVGAPVLAQ
ncbi:MAG: cytochrome c oxidase subunit 3 [Parvibaculales bacterium]